MAEGISLEHGGLTNGRRALELARDEIRRRVESAGDAADDSASAWQGSSGSAARGAVAEWSTEMKRLLMVLDGSGNRSGPLKPHSSSPKASPRERSEISPD